LVEKLKGKRPHANPTLSWEDNIRIDLGETGWEGADSKHLAQEKYQ
jgi:hypothetical protein